MTMTMGSVGCVSYLMATYYSLNNKIPVKFHQNSGYCLIRIFEISILTLKREKQPKSEKERIFSIYCPSKVPTSELI